MVEDDSSTTVEMQPVARSEAPRPAFTGDDLTYRVPPQLRNVDFPAAMRGYDREAVDAYVRRVNQVIAELEVSRSPEAAVRHALDRVGKQTIAVLQEARESADKLMAAAREEADEAMARAKAEAANLVVNSSAEADQTKAEAEQVLASARAEAERVLAQARSEADALRKQTETEIAARREEAEERMRDIQADTQVVWTARDRLLEETHAMADRLQELAAAAGTRLVQEPAPAQQPSAGQPPSSTPGV